MDGAQGRISAAAAVAGGHPVLVNSFGQWRDCARDLLAHKVAPHQVQWVTSKDDGDLFSNPVACADDEDSPDAPGAAADVLAAAGVPAAAAEVPVTAGAAGSADAPAAAGASAVASMPAARPVPPANQLRIPRQLMDMLQSAACCRVPNRWAFLYLVLWRWKNGEKDVMSAADEDGAKLHSMVKAVRREEHDMHAYIRFRERREESGPPRFVAWFEPGHDVLPQVARHFAARMGRVTWMIATPDASVMWDGASLHTTGPLMRGPEDIDDAGEALWLTYYRSIFNPARLNADLLHSHIPSRFWKNLPEGSIVPGMVSQAAAGARKVGQVESVGRRHGTAIPITPEKAQPQRDAPSSLDQCRRCDLWKNSTQAVGGAGPKGARIMLVGEQPGDQEDLAGEPFVGPAGKLLDRALGDAELDRREVYLTNAVKHFKWEPRGKRRLHKTPAQREIEACSFWLQGELEEVGPGVVVAMGSTALKAVTGDPHAALKDAIGKPFQHDGKWIVAVYHPSYVLRVPGDDAKAEAYGVMVEGFRTARKLEAPGKGS